jgi:uncharacterized protein with ATP-grasp and redox domains
MEVLMKREAKIILPMLDNSGNSLESVHRKLEDELTLSFGGATVDFGLRGLWRNRFGEIKSEPVAIYLVAVNDDPDARTQLNEIAKRYGEQARQQVVYVRHANGEVQFHDLTPPANDNDLEVPVPADKAQVFLM